MARLFNVPEDLLESVRDAVAFCAGDPHYVSMASFVAGAFRRELKRLQDEAHGGKPFPKRKPRAK